MDISVLADPASFYIIMTMRLILFPTQLKLINLESSNLRMPLALLVMMNATK